MAQSPKVTAYIALGSNLGDRAGMIARAVELLGGTEGIRVGRVSSLIETEAVGGAVGSPDYLNGVVEVLTWLPARELLLRLLAIEGEMGRVRTARWEARVIDLDLLLYGDAVIEEEGIIVPHPRMGERRFVLEPLAELARELVVPGVGKSVQRLLDECRPSP
jgi:2-amino-4-hydroxy-6-hydroxymethyldihydropteridine diphosphokinase